MANTNTQPVNFKADSAFYKQTKDMLEGSKVAISDILNAALRKVATGAVSVDEFVAADLSENSYQVAFEDLKKEILRGHQDIQAGRVTSLADVRKEFNLD